ncbi:Holliday junction branch migration protein RuvA [Mycoplasmatota bacterium zrk1]
MYAYLIGAISEQYPTHVVLECNGIGFLIKTPNPYVFSIDKTYKVYTYQHVREDLIELYGFIKKDERELFLKLISVKGIGPKGALAILATGSVSSIISAIESGNSEYLRKFPGIGPKASQQIVLDLKGKFSDVGHLIDNNINDVREVLLSLGYSSKEVNKVLQKIPFEDNSLDEMIKIALQMMLK